MLRFYLPDGTTQLFSFSTKFEADGITFEEPNDQMFSFNSPIGACPTCEGFGKVIGIDEHLVVPDRSLSVYEGAIAVTEDNAEIIKAKALSRLTKQLQEAQDDPVSYSEDEVYKMFGVEK